MQDTELRNTELRNTELRNTEASGSRGEQPTTKATARPAANPQPDSSVETHADAFPLEAHELTWEFELGRWGRVPVVVTVPKRSSASQRLPALITFHGRGETLKGPARGVRGWLDDYALERAMANLNDPPLSREDFGGMVSAARLATINEQLKRAPHTPLIVAMPYLPDMLKGEHAFSNASALAEMVVERLLPKLGAETPAVGVPASTGIDGVSLGGRAALLVGLSKPKAFGAVAGIQAAVDENELDRFADLAKRAQQENSGLSLRLLTSSEDYYRGVLVELQQRFERRGVESDLLIVQGTHSYAFNRGPGAIEMLLYHGQVLTKTR